MPCLTAKPWVRGEGQGLNRWWQQLYLQYFGFPFCTGGGSGYTMSFFSLKSTKEFMTVQIWPRPYSLALTCTWCWPALSPLLLPPRVQVAPWPDNLFRTHHFVRYRPGFLGFVTLKFWHWLLIFTQYVYILKQHMHRFKNSAVLDIFLVYKKANTQPQNECFKFHPKCSAHVLPCVALLLLLLNYWSKWAETLFPNSL